MDAGMEPQAREKGTLNRENRLATFHPSGPPPATAAICEVAKTRASVRSCFHRI